MLRTLAVLAATVAGARAACSSHPEQPCHVMCHSPVANGEVLVWDLSGFRTGTGYIDTTDSAGHHYYLDACGPISQVVCTGSTVIGPAAIQSWGGSPPGIPAGLCADLGAFASQRCNVFPGSGGGAPSLSCAYSGGDGGRSVEVGYRCMSAPSPPAASQAAGNTYEIRLSGPAGCGQSYAPPGGGVSGGTLFLILLPLALLLYAGGGAAYNVKARGAAPGLEALPQREMWAALPGLVSDGCGFSAGVAKGLYGRMRGDRPLDPSLSTRLATSEEGADDGT